MYGQKRDHWEAHVVVSCLENQELDSHRNLSLWRLYQTAEGNLKKCITELV
jgi:hypothetical protein